MQPSNRYLQTSTRNYTTLVHTICVVQCRDSSSCVQLNLQVLFDRRIGICVLNAILAQIANMSGVYYPILKKRRKKDLMRSNTRSLVICRLSPTSKSGIGGSIFVTAVPISLTNPSWKARSTK